MSHRQGQTTGSGLLWSLQAETSTSRARGSGTPPEVNQECRCSSLLSLVFGGHRPGINHPDHVVYEIIGRLLSDGRTSRLYKSLVETQQLALCQGFSGFQVINIRI